MNMPHFVIVSGPDKDATFGIPEGGPHVLGRNQEAAFRIDDARCSRFHCHVHCQNGRVTLTDQGGAGGTLVNGVRIEKQTLKEGDKIQVGETHLVFHNAVQADAETLRVRLGAEIDTEAVDDLAKLTGRSLGRYRIGGILGKGTMSMTFKAFDDEDDRTVALKIMQPAFSKDEEEMQRFVRAMKSAMPLKHANLTAMHDAGKSGPYCWAAMEYVDGESARDMIERIGNAGLLDWQMGFRVALHIARALDYAHGMGMIHRNIAPPNILWDSALKRALLNNLLLAKALDGVLAQQVTKPGEMVGDINYMSPERATGDAKSVDHRSDLFSLGATVYALLTGNPPFAGGTFIATIRNIRTADPIKPSVSQMGIPSAFEGAVLKLLAKAPDQRYQSAGELSADLERIGRLNGMDM